MNMLKLKYPGKRLVFILDNLWAHKSSLIMDLMKDDLAYMLLLPSHTPEFSPIENMFGLVKKRMKDFEFKKKEQTALAIMNEMYGLEDNRIAGFFKKTL